MAEFHIPPSDQQYFTQIVRIIDPDGNSVDVGRTKASGWHCEKHLSSTVCEHIIKAVSFTLVALDKKGKDEEF